jgi:hypothetical protein
MQDAKDARGGGASGRRTRGQMRGGAAAEGEREGGRAGGGAEKRSTKIEDNLANANNKFCRVNSDQ